jgi:hypothetical protein
MLASTGLTALGLIGLKCFPQLVSVVPGSERIQRYQQQILAALTPAEAAVCGIRLSRQPSATAPSSSPSLTTAPSQPSPVEGAMAEKRPTPQ